MAKWICNNCETINDADSYICEVCDSRAPHVISFQCECSDISKPSLCSWISEDTTRSWIQLNDDKPIEIFDSHYSLPIKANCIVRIIGENAITKRISEFEVLISKPIIELFETKSGVICYEDEKVIVHWRVKNAEKCTLNGSPIEKEGKLELSPTKRIQLVASNSAGKVTKGINIKSLKLPQIDFTTDSPKIRQGSHIGTKLHWDIRDAKSATLIFNETIEHIPLKGTIDVTPHSNTQYRICVIGLDGKRSFTKDTTISVFPEATFSFTSDKEYVFPSIPFTLTWKTTHAKKVELNGRTIAKEGSYCMKDGIAKETSFTLRVTDEFGTKEQTISVKMLPIPRIESIVVPIPNIEQSVNLQISLAVPDISIQLPTYVQKELELLPSEVYDIQIDTSAAPSPPEVKLIELHTDNSWTTKLQLLAKKLHNRLHNEIN